MVRTHIKKIREESIIKIKQEGEEIKKEFQQRATGYIIRPLAYPTICLKIEV